MRKKYTVIFIVLLIIEVVIALFIHDNFIRPYIGDVLVVFVLYAAIRIIIPQGHKRLPLYVFLFATTVEILQYFKIVEILGLQNNPFLRTLIGTVFDPKDILSYAVGCILLSIYQQKVNH